MFCKVPAAYLDEKGQIVDVGQEMAINASHVRSIIAYNESYTWLDFQGSERQLVRRGFEELFLRLNFEANK
jgi:hypothetical protein